MTNAQPTERAADLRHVRSRALTPVEAQFYGPLVVQLVARRHALGLSQMALEHRLGVSEGQIAKWERGARLPSSFFLCAWARCLGVELTVTARQ
jgi:DNA-binding transcriptional regulator YiaG